MAFWFPQMTFLSLFSIFCCGFEDWSSIIYFLSSRIFFFLVLRIRTNFWSISSCIFCFSETIRSRFLIREAFTVIKFSLICFQSQMALFFLSTTSYIPTKIFSKTLPVENRSNLRLSPHTSANPNLKRIFKHFRSDSYSSSLLFLIGLKE